MSTALRTFVYRAINSIRSFKFTTSSYFIYRTFIGYAYGGYGSGPIGNIVVPGDPYITLTRVILTGESETIINTAPVMPLTPVVQNSTTTTAQKKYGARGLNVTGGARLYFPGTTQTIFASNDFTIEFWFYFGGFLSNQFIVGIEGQSNPLTHIHVISDNFFYQGSPTSPFLKIYQRNDFSGLSNIITSPGMSINGWAHLALQRRQNNLEIYKDGTLQTSTPALGLITTEGSTIHFGSLPGSYSSLVTGNYFDDIRVTVGVARYSGSFTPPGPLS